MYLSWLPKSYDSNFLFVMLMSTLLTGNYCVGTVHALLLAAIFTEQKPVGTYNELIKECFRCTRNTMQVCKKSASVNKSSTSQPVHTLSCGSPRCKQAYFSEKLVLCCSLVGYSVGLVIVGMALIEHVLCQ